MTNNVDLLDKFAISPVQLPTTRKFFYDTPQPTSIINNSVHLKIDNNADKDGQQEHIHIVKSGSLEGELQNTQRQNTISPAEKNLKLPAIMLYNLKSPQITKQWMLIIFGVK